MTAKDPSHARQECPPLRLLQALRGLPWTGLRLVGAGFLAGIAASLSLMSVAQEPVRRGDAPAADAPDARRMAEALQLIRRNALHDVSASEITDGCLAGIARAADPESEFYDAKRFAELRQSASPRAGLGLELRLQGDLPVVVAPIDGSPAERAGIQPGDTLVKIDDATTGGMTLSDVVRRLQGEPHSLVTLTLRRNGANSLLERRIEREFIRLRPVQSRRLAQGLAYVRLSQFSDTSLRGFATEMMRLTQEGPVPTGLVLDLRNNPGGVLDAAVGLASAFLPRDTLVLTLRGRAEEANRQFRATPVDYSRTTDELARLPAWTKTVPVAVLVDSGSAAGSEIVAGALQDHRRAVIVGERTFGRGIIQTMFPLSASTALKLTTAEWLTPAGTPIARRGITPDVEARRGDGASEDTALAAATARMVAR
ncbi:MAG: S41 family peptidase [Rhodoferax sp.]|nr:S41 family peptidase [Rhodoferax sp.]